MDESPLALPPNEEENGNFTLCQSEKRSYESFSEQSSRPYSFDPLRVSERVKRGYKMIIKKGTKRVTLLRFLLSKMIFGEDGISIEEYLCLFHLYFDLIEITEEKFVQSHSSDLEKVGIILNCLTSCTVFPLILSEESKDKVITLLERFLPTRREFFGLKGQRDLRLSFRIVLNDTLVPRKIPQKAFIGVGYKDKGTRRNTAYDGSPGWQIVSSYFANLEREAEELDSSTFNSHID